MPQQTLERIQSVLRHRLAASHCHGNSSSRTRKLTQGPGTPSPFHLFCCLTMTHLQSPSPLGDILPTKHEYLVIPSLLLLRSIFYCSSPPPAPADTAELLTQTDDRLSVQVCIKIMQFISFLSPCWNRMLDRSVDGRGGKHYIGNDSIGIMASHKQRCHCTATQTLKQDFAAWTCSCDSRQEVKEVRTKERHPKTLPSLTYFCISITQPLPPKGAAGFNILP